MVIPKVTLSSGHKIPLIGLGTWKLNHKQCVDSVKLALKLGYRHIDTAHMYDNHKEIKKGIEGFDRSSLFITSKLALDQVNDNKIESSIEKACDLALKELGLDYLDLYLLHWPDHTRPMKEMLQAMQKLKEQKKVRTIGMSNCTVHHLQDALDAGIEVSVNQVEFHPYLYQKKLLEFCQKKNIHITAYRSLGKGELLNEPLFSEIGAQHSKTPAQVVLRWLVQQGISVIPMSTSEKHLKENLDIFSFSLSEKEMSALSQLNRNFRFCDADWAVFEY